MGVGGRRERQVCVGVSNLSREQKLKNDTNLGYTPPPLLLRNLNVQTALRLDLHALQTAQPDSPPEN